MNANLRIFNKAGDWTSKVNFVDSNNVLVGYDMEQSCCESADWFLADTPQARVQDRTLTPQELPGWQFDTTYFKEVSGNEFDGGGMAIFRLTNGPKEQFLHLYNCHNGYYSHGFEFKAGEHTLKEGSL